MAETIKLNDLRRIVREEMESKVAAPDHLEAPTISAAAAKLLTALEAFEEKAPEAAKSSLVSVLPNLKKTLEDMKQHPGNFTMKTNPGDVHSADESPKPLEQGQKVKVIDKTKPVLDHHTFESINHKVKKLRSR